MSCENGAAQSNHGKIELIFGPMFSGKTTELIRRCKRYHLAKYSCVVIKYANDTRYSNGNAVTTHDKLEFSAVPALQLAHVWDLVQGYDVVAVDEAQFFPGVVEFSERLANQGKTVLVAALDGDYLRRPFANGILSLVPRAEHVLKLQAVCMICHRDAAFTLRLCDDTQVEVIGGADKYAAACRSCHGAHAVGSRPSSAAVEATPLHNLSNHSGLAKSPTQTPLSPHKSPAARHVPHDDVHVNHAKHKLFDVDQGKVEGKENVDDMSI